MRRAGYSEVGFSKRVLTRSCVGVCALLVAFSVYSQAQVVADLPVIRNFKVPEYDENMEKKGEIVGDTAKRHPNGLIDITKFRLDLYEKGMVHLRITAPTCTLNQVTKNAKSDSSVRIIRSNMVITGKGFDYDHEHRRFEIHSQAKVVFRDVSSEVFGE